MNATQNLFKNIGSLFTSQVLGYIITLIFTIYLVRYLGVQNYGVLSFALALISMLGIFADFGLNTLMTREIVRDNSLTNKYLNNLFSIKLLMVSILMIFVVLFVKILNYPSEMAYILIFMMVFLIFSTFSNFFAALFQAYEKLEYQSIMHIIIIHYVLFIFLYIHCNK